MSKIYVITKKEEFDRVHDEFKTSALIKTNPNIYHIGLDIEYICKANFPVSFAKCTKWVKKAMDELAVCKLQLSTDKITIIIDLCQFCDNQELPDNLIKILKLESWIKTGVGIYNDIIYLSNNYCLDQCNGYYDLKIIGQLKDINCSLIGLHNRISGDNNKKDYSNTICDWSQKLTEEQIKYIVQDSYMSYIVGKCFISNIISFDMFPEKKEIYQNKMDVSNMIINTFSSSLQLLLQLLFRLHPHLYQIIILED